MSKTIYYVKNGDLAEELRIYQETGKITEKLGYMIMSIAEGMSRKSNFNGYTWLDDMKGEAICRTLRYLHNVDPDKNPFAYISQICYNVFREHLNKEDKKAKVKDKLYDYWSIHRREADEKKKAINYEKMLK